MTGRQIKPTVSPPQKHTQNLFFVSSGQYDEEEEEMRQSKLRQKIIE